MKKILINIVEYFKIKIKLKTSSYSKDRIKFIRDTQYVKNLIITNTIKQSQLILDDLIANCFFKYEIEKHIRQNDCTTILLKNKTEYIVKAAIQNSRGFRIDRLFYEQNIPNNIIETCLIGKYDSKVKINRNLWDISYTI